jgi:histone-lysine N-methyltransferase SETD1
LEQSPGAEAVAAPLTKKSVAYNFCFHQPPIEAVMDLQRKRAAVAAEQALENASGSARTEGMEAVTQSTGSGRITRALVRSVEDDIATDIKRTEQEEQKAKADRESNQRKYNELKSAPLESRLVARRSHIHGWGLFTKVDLPKDSMIVEYMGETVYRSVADKREKEYEKSGIGSCYMFRLDLQRIVDATMIGCMARFMNHCCRPNAYAKIISVDTELGPDKKIVVFSNRDIAAGEEITYDYKFPVEDGSLKCTCGAPNCIGRMN